ncbi:MAG: hypothetical protein IPP88_25400 [Betaproteobacteria bacterium]|nr:hypothetical protein [Betaproteobacteria bacterium]
MPVRAVLDELLRVGVVRKLANGEVEPISESAVVPDSENKQALLAVLGEDSADFLTTISHNVMASPEQRFFQQRAYADNLPIETLSETKAISRQKGEAIIDDLRPVLQRRDITPSSLNCRGRAVFGIYYYEEVTDDGTDSKSDSEKTHK